MLTKKLDCPSCGVHLKVARTLPPGKMIKCPKCSQSFAVPDPEDDEPLKVESEPLKTKNPTPLSESSAPKAALAKRRKVAPPPDEEASESGEKRQRVSQKKRRKRQKQSSSNTPLVLGLVIGGVVLVIGAVAFIAWRSSANKNAPLAQNSSSPPGPAMAAASPGRPRGPRGQGPEIAPPESADPKPEARPTSSAPAPTQVAEVSDRSSNGQALFEAQCTRCHRSGGGGGGPGRGRGGRGPDLSRVGAKRSVDWLAAHIRDPRSHNPNSRMPGFEEDKLSEGELRSLAEYLASLK